MRLTQEKMVFNLMLTKLHLVYVKSYLQCQVSPMSPNLMCAVCPSVQWQPLQVRVLWLCEPLSACCLSYRENTKAKTEPDKDNWQREVKIMQK